MLVNLQKLTQISMNLDQKGIRKGMTFLFINAVYTYLVTGKLDALPDGAMRYVVAMYGLSDEDKDQLLEYQ